MTNAIPNVPRELLADLLGNDHDKRIMAERHLLAMLANAPSPAGVDGCKGKNCGATDGVSHSDECIAEHEQACGRADLNGLPVVAYLIGGEPSLTPCPVCGVVNEPLCRLSDAQAIIDGLRGEVADLHTTMMAAAVEIQEHWAAHCDEEGYGPANLMHRLERGIASQYGYSAETLVRLESQRDQQAQRIGELEGLLRSCLPALSDGGCAALANRIDAALSDMQPHAHSGS